jgi:hypothetical protein
MNSEMKVRNPRFYAISLALCAWTACATEPPPTSSATDAEIEVTQQDAQTDGDVASEVSLDITLEAGPTDVPSSDIVLNVDSSDGSSNDVGDAPLSDTSSADSDAGTIGDALDTGPSSDGEGSEDAKSVPCPDACDDGDPCNGLEVCDLSTGVCAPGAPLSCDDDDACTTDSCDGGCEHVPVSCADGNGCTIDTCDPVSGCTSVLDDCDDDDPCTEDGCSPNGGCWHSDITCADEDACTTDSCGADGCVYAPLDCGDGTPCTIDACDSVLGCTYTDANCDDGEPCTQDGCSPNGGCLSWAITCEDEDPCTTDSCVGGQGCVFEPLSCPTDEDPCTDEICDGAGDCASVKVQCEDNDLCTTDTCDPLKGDCIFAAVDCEDGDMCTSDTCDAATGDCLWGAVECDDGLLCTTDACHSLTGTCVYTPVQCVDGDLCDGEESCDPGTGQCVDGEEVLCVDNNSCDGMNLCDPSTGTCVDGPPVDCTPGPDFDGCAGDMECDPFSGGCDLDPLNDLYCPFAPDACGQTTGTVGPKDGEVVELQSGYFVLRDDEQWSKREAIVDQIGAHPSVTKTSLSAIIAGDLNRTATSINLPLIDCVNGGWTWNEGDQDVDYWWPQGVTGSVDGWGDISAGENGLVAGTDVMMVSWYHKAEEDSGTSKYKGVRVSVVDTWGKKYRHLILAEPVCNGSFTGGSCNGTVDYEPLASASSSLHAGGIVWYKNYVYLADTSHGFRVFDLTRIHKVQTGEKNQLGYDAGDNVYYGYNYQYVLPQVGYYDLCGASCCARFSWAGFDGTTDPPSIVAGEYVSSSKTGRAHRWDLDPSTGKLQTNFKVAKSSGAYFPGVSNMQGGLSVNGHFFISSSKLKFSLPLSGGSLWDGAPGGSLEDHQWPKLPEDLYYDGFTDRLWTCTEEPASFLGNTRYCVHADRSDVQNNACD